MDLLNLSQLARRADCAPATVRRLYRAGKIIEVARTGKWPLFDASHVDRVRQLIRK